MSLRCNRHKTELGPSSLRVRRSGRGVEAGLPVRHGLVACRIPHDLKQKLISHAAERDLSVSQFVRMGIRLMMESGPGADSDRLVLK